MDRWPRRPGHWRTDIHNSAADGHLRYEPTSIFEIVPADGHAGCQLEETKTSVRPSFFGSSSASPSLPAYCTMGAQGMQRAIGVIHLCVEIAMWPTWSTATALDRRRSRIDNFSSYPHMATFGSSIPCSRQGTAATTELIISRNCDHFFRRPLSPVLFNSLLRRVGRQRGPRLPNGLMNATHSSPWASTVRRLALQRMHHRLWFLSFVCRTEHFTRNKE